MSHVPKKALRAIAKANLVSAARQTQYVEATAEIPTPKVMGPGTPRAVMNLHDVYFNGERQHLCSFASVTEGRITRWTRGIPGRLHLADRNSPQEELRGKVEIRRKPEFMKKEMR